MTPPILSEIEDRSWPESVVACTAISRRREEQRCWSETDTRPGCLAGSTPASRTRRPRSGSTRACSGGSSRTACPPTRPGATSWPGCAAGRRRGRVAVGPTAPDARLEDLRLGRQRRRDHRQGEGGGRSRAGRALRRRRRRPHGRSRRPRGRRVLRLGGEGAQGRPAGQRARHVELQRAEHPRSGGRADLLQGRVRVGGHHDRHRQWRLHDVAPARLRRLPGAARSRPARAPGDGRRARGLRGRGRVAGADVERPVPRGHAGALEHRRSRSTTPTRSPSGPRSSAARCWRRPSTHRGSG